MILEKLLKEPLEYPDRQEVDALVQEAMRCLPDSRADLSSRVSHAIRTPLAAILGFREVLELDMNISEADRKTYREVIESETWRLQRFLISLQVIQHSLDATLSLERTEDDINTTVADAVTRCLQEAGTKKIRIDTIPAPEGTKITADHDRTRLAVEHLLLNSIRASEREGIITVEVVAHGDRVDIIVEDQGHGIDQNQKEDLQKPFRRIPRTDDNGGELGIGLTIVRSIVDRHQGTISIASEPTHGTTITISLPA